MIYGVAAEGADPIGFGPAGGIPGVLAPSFDVNLAPVGVCHALRPGASATLCGQELDAEPALVSIPGWDFVAGDLDRCPACLEIVSAET
jgi:hypothetical protein